jgi:5-methylcytosine-specific restriction endonuclease McrA
VAVRLTEAQRAEIHTRFKAGEINRSALGREYGVSHETIRCIVTPGLAERNRTREAARYSANPKLSAKRKSEYRAANPEKEAARLAKRQANPEPDRRGVAGWRATHPEKVSEQKRRRYAQELGASGDGYTFDQWLTVCEIWAGCAYCRRFDTVLQVDHIIPISRDGTNHPSNLVPACGPCNSSKKNRLLSEWRNGDHCAVAAFAKEVAEYVLGKKEAA